MQAKYKWLLLPPAIALILVLGPFGKSGAGLFGTPSATEDAPASQSAMADPVGSSRPELPEAWEVISTLIGVLLLGGAGVVMLGKMRHRPRAGVSGFARHRQSLRLSPKHTIHAIEVDDQILLVGECDSGLSVLHSRINPELAADEQEVAERDEEEGAVPKDMILPRPSRRVSQPAEAREQAEPAVKIPTPANFKTLMQKARELQTTR